MTRLTQRISTMWSSVKCPRCGKMVHPDQIALAGATPTPGANAKRWSLLWLPPRGDVCPECDFPIAKYVGRIKWIRLMMVSVLIVLVALFLQMIALVAQSDAMYIAILKRTVLAGAVLFAIGSAGVILGKRH